MSEHNKSQASGAAQEQLLRALMQKRRETAAGKLGSAMPDTEMEGTDGTLPQPLSPGQKRLWFLNQWLPNHSSYNIPIAIRATGELRMDALEASVQQLLRRHDVLRARFETRDGEPWQIAEREPDFRIRYIDLRGQALTEGDLQSIINEEAKRPFVLTEGKLFRATVWRIEDEEFVLLFNMHHIVADGWSIGIIFKEIGRCYNAWLRGQQLPEARPWQYADFTRWQSGEEKLESIGNGLSFWREHLKDAPRLLELPTDFPRPQLQANTGGSIPFELSSELVEALKQLARKEEATLYHVLLAAFQLLLRRYSGQTDVVVGMPVANRRRQQFEETVGFFVNTIALRSRIDDNLPFVSYLQQLKSQALDVYSHQHVPFERLVDELQIERNTSHSPIFQAMLSYNNTPMSLIRLDGLRLETLTVDTETAKLDLTLEIWDGEAGLKGRLEYNSELFGVETALRLGRHYLKLLESAAASPTCRLWELDMFGPEERRQLLLGRERSEAGADELPFAGQAIHARVERQAQCRPDAIAVVCGEEQLTYDGLNRRANRLAHELRRRGVGRNDTVGLCLERSVDTIVAILGIWKAGGAYVPLDPHTPSERLSFIMEDSQTAWLVTEQSLLPQWSHLACDKLCVEHVPRGSDLEQNLPFIAEGDDLAYIIYTSGSTGKPKGVLTGHRNAARLFDATEAWFSFGEGDVWTMFHSYAFDFSVWEMWGALAYGGKLVVVPYWTSRSTEQFYDLLVKEQVTVLNQTPSAFRQLIREDERRAASGEGTALALRCIIFGGEALELNGLRPWIDRHGDDTPRLVNMYGITETTVHVTYRRIRRQDVLEGRGSVIGEPIPDLNVYVLDERLQPVAPGVTGELYIGGAGVARGYLNRPELTAERFLPSPFREGETLYRSGDLARRLAGGELVYIGRSDDQVKIRGFRIELAEIESALCRHPHIKEAVVLVDGDDSSEKRLIAFLVVEERKQPTAAEIRDFLFRTLPDYMIPSLYEARSSLPLTGNGKVDRRALLGSLSERLAAHAEYAPPSNEAERTMAGIWQSVLNVERVGAEDNFFALGGDSILALQAVAAAKGQGFVISLQTLFQLQTVRGVCASATAEGVQMADEVVFERLEPFYGLTRNDVERLPEDATDAYPLTGLQAGMLFHMDRNESSTSYLNMTSLKICAAYNRPLLQKAINHIVMSHAVLRTSFDFASCSEPLQIVRRYGEAPLEETDISGLSEAEQERFIDQWIAGEVRRKFDLSRPPLLRFAVHVRGPQFFQFSLTECHAILDGWSFTSIIRDLFMEYYRLQEGGESVEPVGQAFSFRDFVWMERRSVQSGPMRQYWMNRLSGFPMTRVPRWTLREEERNRRLFQRSVRPIPKEIERGIRALAAEAKAPIKSVLLAAHMKLLQMLNSQSDVMTGLVSNGRPEVEGSDQIRGLFLNTLPFRLSVSEGSWLQLVEQIFAHEREILPYRHFPLSEMQRSFGSKTLFETAFNFVHFHALRDLVDGTGIELLDLKEEADTNFTLQAAFSMIPTTGELMLMLDTNGVEITREQSEAYADYYLRILKEMTDHPRKEHRAYSLLNEEERRRMTIELNDTEIGFPFERCLHHWIEEQVYRTPGETALVFETERLTYREMNERANRLASYVRKQGATGNQWIGVCMDRSIHMTISLLAVLKAGCAYVPIDPGFPDKRIADIVADAGLSLVLTEQKLCERIEFGEAQPICVDAIADLLKEESPCDPAVAVAPDSLAYVIYTSGSTGKPKGVKLHHKGLCNRLLWMQDQYGLNRTDRVLQKTPFGFDVSVWEFFWPLMNGATLVVAAPGGHRDTGYLTDIIRRESITTIHFVPSMLRLLLNDRRAAQCASLRRVICSGEALTTDLEQQFLATLDAELYNLYGPTEASIDVTHWSCRPEAGQASVPIGRPIANTSIYIVDENGAPVPVGVAGELYIGGVGVGEGYTDEALTKQKFVDDPFRPGGKIFKTGDAARWLPDGNIVYIGRLDYQLKIAGNRIEPGEIEAVLLRNKYVKEAVVSARQDRTGNLKLYAYIVPPAPLAAEDVDRYAVRMFLKRHLPEYMQPAQIVALEQFPLNINGKIDRGALPDPEPSEVRPQAYEAPQSAEEIALARLWERVLHVERAGRLDNFMALGGHSLVLIRLAQLIEETFEVQADLTELLEADNLEGMAHYIAAQRSQVASY